MTYTVFVKWFDAHRAERLGTDGYTTTRRVHAAMFSDKESASKAGAASCEGLPGVERWWVAPF